MNEALLPDAVAQVFAYSSDVSPRRHAPNGYFDFGSFKPWLRDEFKFRCVYCLIRETWRPDGKDGFSVDHIEPQSLSPERRTDYENLLYACCSCNALRGAKLLPFDLSREALGKHLSCNDTGRVVAFTREGQMLVDLCLLNRPRLVEFRRRLLNLLHLLFELHEREPEALAALVALLSFPADLPDLAALRPPNGNARAANLTQSYFALRASGSLSEIY